MNPSLKAFLQTWGPAVLSGIALSLAFPRASLFSLAWIALIPLFAHTWKARPKNAFAEFLLAGWILHLVLLQWALVQVYYAGGWVIFGWIFLALYYGLYWGVVGALWAWASNRLPHLVSPVVAAFLWMAMEHIQGQRFTLFGMPGALAYSQGPNTWVVQLAAIGGAPLVGGVVIFVTATLAIVVGGKAGRKRLIAMAIAVLVIAHLLGLLALNAGRAKLAIEDATLVAGIFQADFPIEMKHDPEFTEEMVRIAVHRSEVLAERHDIDLFVWPEALVMGEITEPGIRVPINGLLQQTNAHLFTGSARSEPNPQRYFNSAYFIAPTGEIVAQYDKLQLAPFGEYVPLGGLFPFIEKIVPTIGALTPGTERVVMPLDRHKLGPLICFEVLFPSMAQDLRRDGANVLVVATNLGWFGMSNILPLEFEVARLRAIETRTPLIHAGNTGISGVFDPYGGFRGINAYIDAEGRYHTLRDELSPRQTAMLRLAGAVSVPRQTSQSFPAGPRLIPWLAALAAGGLFVFAAFRGPKAEP